MHLFIKIASERVVNMKKKLSVFLCIVMIITAFPFASSAGDKVENPLAGVTVEEELTLFYDDYYPEESYTLTAVPAGENEGDVTDISSAEWRSLDPKIASVRADEEDSLKATVSAVGTGTVNIVIEVTSTSGQTFSDVCKVTVRASLKTHYDAFKIMMNEIPADVDDKPAKYASAAMTQLKSTFSEIQEHFNPSAQYESYALWKTALLDNVREMNDTPDNCLLIDGWKTKVMTAASSLSNSVIATEADEEFWAKWKEAYDKLPEDVAIAYALLPEERETAYTEKSVKAVFDVLAKYKDEWLKSEKDELDSLAEELSGAIDSLKEHTTQLFFDSGKVTKNYGVGTFRVPVNAVGYDEVEWSSTDDKIATVNQNGDVTILSAIPEGYTKKVRIIAVSYKETASYELEIINPVSSIKVSERLAVLIGDTKKITVEAQGTDKECPVTNAPVLEFTCDNEEIATVDADGVITPLQKGKCNITVKVKDNKLVSPVVCEVSVAPAQKVTRLTVVHLPEFVTVNASAEAKLYVYPPQATNKTVKWTSSDETVAKVTEVTTDELSYATAKITGVSTGNCVIKYEATDGSGVSGSFSLTVQPLVAFITFNKTNITTYINSTDTLKIEATCQPINAGNQKLLWISSDEDVATVVDGKITVHKTGTCTVTAIAQDGSGASKSANLLVLGDSRSIVMEGAPAKMNVDDKVNLICTVVTNQGISYNVRDWSVSDKELASVTSDGLFTALRPGKVTVTAKYFDGNSVSKTITIVAPLNGISLPSTLTVSLGKTKTLTPTFEPEYATNKNVKWTTSDSKVASVSTGGVITAAGTGTAIITAKSEEGGYVASCKVIVIKNVTDVTISKTSYTLTMGNSESFKLSATVSPSDATTKDISWSSDNTSVAVVSSSGVVTAKGPGTAKITVKTLDGGYTATCKVTVKQPLKGIAFSSSKASFYVGEKRSLKVVFTPSNASNKGLTYKSSDKSIATVSESGVVTAKKKGSCTVTAVSDDGGYKAKCTVSVKKKVNVQDVNITKSSVTVNAGKTKQLTAEIYPDNSSVKDVKWTVSDKSIASVNSNGLVTAHKGGVVTVKCTSVDTGVSDKCKVTVYEGVKSITLSATSATLVAGKTKILTASVSPSTATDKSLTWYSTNKSIAKVSSSGKITALKGGTCKIVAKSKDNPDITAKCTITVLQPPTKITLSETELEISRGDKAILTASVSPQNSFDKNITWSSSNSSVASVSSTGIVRGVSAGTAVITCKSTADPSVKRVCNVTVYQPVTGVKLSAERVTLTTGRTKTLVATVSPAKASNKKVTFSTSNKNVARVSSKGVVDAIGPGQATITVKTKDGFYTAKCLVTVIEPVISVSLDKKSTTISVGKTKTLIATVKPSKATNKDVVWRSSNPLVARVSQSGKITALKEGTATITCTTDDGGYKASCKVHCIIPVNAVSVSSAELTIKKGSTKTLRANIYPSNATVNDVTWTTSDKSVATVDKQGKITAVKKGVCIITCTTKQGGKKATCIVTVK